MATIDVVNLGGEKVGSLELADEVFGAVNEDLLWEAVKHYRASQRAGTHATKNKKLVSGAGKKLLGALRSALASKLADGKLVVVDSFEVKEPKTKAFRAALDAIKSQGTTLLIEQSSSDNKNLVLASRNLDGVELVAGNVVHPYHLLRYEFAVFSRPAIEKLQDSLKATASSRRREQTAEKKPRRRARREKVGEVA